MKHTLRNRISCFCCSILLSWVVDVSAQSGVGGNFGVQQVDIRGSRTQEMTIGLPGILEWVSLTKRILFLFRE